MPTGFRVMSQHTKMQQHAVMSSLASGSMTFWYVKDLTELKATSGPYHVDLKVPIDRVHGAVQQDQVVVWCKVSCCLRLSSCCRSWLREARLGVTSADEAAPLLQNPLRNGVLLCDLAGRTCTRFC